jgi:hypothetical protein
MKKPSFLGMILLAIGIGTILYGGILFADTQLFNQWIAAEGKVVDKQVVYIEAVGGTPKPCGTELCGEKVFHAYPMVSYRYTVNDNLYENDLVKTPQVVYVSETQNSLAAENLINQYEIGETVPVFYRKKTPTTAVLILPETNVTFSNFLIMLIGLILVGFVAKQLQNKDPLHASIFVRS